MTPYITQSLAPEPLVDEAVAAPVAGLSPRGLQTRRLKGQDHPPYVRIGSHRIKYALSQVHAWREARTVRGTNPNSSRPTINSIAIGNTLTTNASAIAEIQSNSKITAIALDIVAAQQRHLAQHGHNAVLREVIRTLVDAGQHVTLESALATAEGLADAMEVQHRRDAESAAEVPGAVRFYREATKRLRGEVESAAADMRTQRSVAAHKRDTLNIVNDPAQELRGRLASTIGVDLQRLKDAGFEIKMPPSPAPGTAAEVEEQNMIAYRLGQKIARLEVFIKQRAIDIDGLAQVATEDGHDGILVSIAHVREVLGLEPAEVIV
ncbi:hypothetical protein WKW77_12155 [Variovorax ureilyticus]|uniref:Uncharacterized protein n=1 Tax=Variovorax ureilyticus TaxID=1836198 RepID=A0ABU8VDT4_9BURK